MKDFILLENCHDDIKLWYLVEIIKFANILDRLEPGKPYDKALTNTYDVYELAIQTVIQIKNRIKSSDRVSKLIMGLITLDEDSISKVKKSIKTKTVKDFLKEHSLLVSTALLRDFIEINYKYLSSFTSLLFDDENEEENIYKKFVIPLDQYLDLDGKYGDPKYLEKNPYLLEFIENNDFTIDFCKSIETGYMLLTTNLIQDVTHDKDLKEQIDVYIMNFSKEDDSLGSYDNYEIENAFYFAGGIFQIPAKDYVQAFATHVKTISRVKTLIGTASSLAMLTNPVTSTIGALSLGVFALNSLSSKKDTKNKIQKAILETNAEAIHRAKLELLKEISAIGSNTVLGYFDDFDNEDMSNLLLYSMFIISAIQDLSYEENKLLCTLIGFDLPQVLDIKRLKTLTSGLDNGDEIYDLIISAYEKIDDKYVFICTQDISEAVLLKNAFDAIGYHTISGYLKKFV